MKIFRFWYNSYGDELYEDYFKTYKKIQKRINELIKLNPNLDRGNFEVEEIEVK